MDLKNQENDRLLLVSEEDIIQAVEAELLAEFSGSLCQSTAELRGRLIGSGVVQRLEDFLDSRSKL